MNNKISLAQLQSLIIISALGFEVLIIPSLMGSITELVLILAAGFLFCIFAVYSNIIINKNRILCFIYSIKNILVIILLTRVLSDTVKNALLSNTSLYRIIFIIAVVSAYSAYMGIESVSRISQMLFWFVVVGTIYIYIMATPDIKFSNIVIYVGRRKVLLSLFLGFLINTAEIIILTKPYMADKQSGILKGCLFAVIMILSISFIIMGKIGYNGIKNAQYPFFEIMYTSNAPSVFIKRQEGIFISLWVISALISIFIYFATTVSYMETLKIDKKVSSVFIMLFVFVSALIYNGEATPVRTYCILQILGGIITVLIIPFIYLFRKKV